MKLKDIKPNPNNPRVIKNDKFKKLKKSLEEFPKMLSIRPMVVDASNIVLGGNQRLRALQDLGYKEIPDAWVRKADELTEDEKRRFIISDNAGFGTWDWDILANQWDTDELIDWGVDLSEDWNDKDVDLNFNDEDEDNNKVEITCPKCGFEWEIEQK